VLVPDFAPAEACLAGKLSHDWIARAGNTTIMDLVALRRDAILIPTHGMTEQAHLAKRYPGVEIGGQTG